MNHKCLLIVDDSRVARMVTKSIIENVAANIHIIEAANGEEALEAIRNNQIDIVLMDHGMPGKTGLDVAIEIKEVQPDIIISMLSANIQDSMKEKAQAIGAGFIEKPATEEKIRKFFNSLEA